LSATVTLNQNQIEKLMEIIEESERCLLEARRIIASQATAKRSITKEADSIPNISKINWRVKGGRIAGSADEFAFDFALDREGQIPRDKAPIIDYIKKRGKLGVDGFDVTRSKDGKFLQRVKVQHL